MMKVNVLFREREGEDMLFHSVQLFRDVYYY